MFGHSERNESENREVTAQVHSLFSRDKFCVLQIDPGGYCQDVLVVEKVVCWYK